MKNWSKQDTGHTLPPSLHCNALSSDSQGLVPLLPCWISSEDHTVWPWQSTGNLPGSLPAAAHRGHAKPTNPWVLSSGAESPSVHQGRNFTAWEQPSVTSVRVAQGGEQLTPCVCSSRCSERLWALGLVRAGMCSYLGERSRLDCSIGYCSHMCREDHGVNVFRDKWAWTQPQLYNQAPSRAPGRCSHGQIMKERGDVGWGLEGAGLTLLLGKRPDSGGRTLQSTFFLAWRLQYGADAVATMATGVKQGWDGGWHFAHRLDRALCWWHMWDTDTATAAKQLSALRTRTGTSICRKQNLQLLAGGLPSLHCNLIRSPQRKWLSALAAPRRDNKGRVQVTQAVPYTSLSAAVPAPCCSSTHSPQPWAPLSCTPQGPHDDIFKGLVPVNHPSSSINPLSCYRRFSVPQTLTCPRSARLHAAPLSPTLLPRLCFQWAVLKNEVGAYCF